VALLDQSRPHWTGHRPGASSCRSGCLLGYPVSFSHALMWADDAGPLPPPDNARVIEVDELALG
jgi:hypothetical protein